MRGQDKAWRAPICLGITVSPSLSHWQPCAWGMCSLHFNYWICPCLQAAGCHCLSISAYPSTLCFTQPYRTIVWLYGLLWPVNGCTFLLCLFATLFVSLYVFVNSPAILREHNGVVHPKMKCHHHLLTITLF